MGCVLIPLEIFLCPWFGVCPEARSSVVFPSEADCLSFAFIDKK